MHNFADDVEFGGSSGVLVSTGVVNPNISPVTYQVVPVLVSTGVLNLILLLWTVPSGVLVPAGEVNPNLSPVTVTVLCYVIPVMMFLTMFTLP
ncbi:hypothetical protein ACOMHN_034380 [Nucella lapillus]